MCYANQVYQSGFLCLSILSNILQHVYPTSIVENENAVKINLNQSAPYSINYKSSVGSGSDRVDQGLGGDRPRGERQ